MSTTEPPTEEDEELVYEEPFNRHEERAKSESSVAYLIAEEICGTVVTITGIICFAILLYHWT